MTEKNLEGTRPSGKRAKRSSPTRLEVKRDDCAALSDEGKYIWTIVCLVLGLAVGGCAFVLAFVKGMGLGDEAAFPR